MPRYDYFCDSCGYTEEVNHGFAEDYNGELCWSAPQDDLDYCSDCDPGCTGAMHRKISATPAILRGTGWAKMTTYKPKKD